MKTESRTRGLRALALFADFLLVILAYYQIKPASRSLYLEHFSAAQLPYVWVLSALVLGALMPAYAKLVSRVSRPRLVVGTCLGFALLLLVFRLWIGGPVAAVCFYVFVDILSVALVEQFWSLTNAAFPTRQGRRWFGAIGAGGLVGGMTGGWLAQALLTQAGLSTVDLLFVSAALIVLVAAFSAVLVRSGVLAEQPGASALPGLPERPALRDWLGNRYLLTITAVLLLAQVVEPIVEYQFMHYVQHEFPERETRTAYLSGFLSLLNAVALGVNLVVTPLVLRALGAIGGLLAQPLTLGLFSFLYLLQPGLNSGAAMKISDRGLSYSLNRAAKELLYVPVAPDLIFKLKAWIDMFGYRAFKVLGASAILLLTEWTHWLVAPAAYSYFTIPAALLWIALVLSLARPYRALTAQEAQNRER
ncbi:ATP translocase [Fontimonas sp. SYSU GA230001]